MADTDWYSGMEDILANIATSLVPIEKLLTGGAYLIGLAFAIKAIMTLKTHGEQRSSMSGTGNIKEAGMYMFVAAMLVYYPTAFETIMNSTFGYQNVLSYASLNSGSPWMSSIFGTDSAAGNTITMIIQIVGLIAFIRGWVLIARASAQGQAPGSTGKGLMHIFGGILAMNIIGTMQVFYNTLFGVS
jgi:intracellular multiplication protein IcmC